MQLRVREWEVCIRNLERKVIRYHPIPLRKMVEFNMQSPERNAGSVPAVPAILAGPAERLGCTLGF
jgi:hypothetical protein